MKLIVILSLTFHGLTALADCDFQSFLHSRWLSMDQKLDNYELCYNFKMGKYLIVLNNSPLNNHKSSQNSLLNYDGLQIAGINLHGEIYSFTYPNGKKTARLMTFENSGTTEIRLIRNVCPEDYTVDSYSESESNGELHLTCIRKVDNEYLVKKIK